MGTRKKITLHDLSAELGLSVQTISKALSGKPGMSEETRSRIARTAYLRGYLTVAQARELASRGIAPYPTFQLRFALIQSRQSANYNQLLSGGLQQRLELLAHRLECHTLDADLPDRAFREWLEETNLLTADGLFIAPRLVSDTMERQLLALPVPKVLINYPKPLSAVDSVIWDVYEAVCLAVDKLVRQGHTRIMYVGDRDSQRGYVRRWQAFQEMMGAHGLTCASGDQLAGNWDEVALLEKLETLRPTALIAGIDEEVGRLLRSLEVLDYRLPEQLSVIGLTNGSVAACPLLSRPELLIRETGYKAADRLLRRIANPSEPWEHIRIAGPFHEGGTVQRPSS
ncbi:LacI family DNA-binding transcriptional regulator [Paenibacillus daejeonensis]|uniref:LacI family DNA-binding transcriptional regulator n=1 Tax=Paenibacillus daejeonensis TaxID=135193 RepID=UPI00037C9EC9|nr:LacI family DNA-binding transcriptional regulator [Paenibacillus daejeonensis]